MRLIMVLAGIGLLSLSFMGLAASGVTMGLCKEQTQEAIRFVERFLNDTPDGFEIPPVRRS